VATPSKGQRRHVLRYDKHMPDVDDVSLIVLKGHLLIEEMLLELAVLIVEQPKHLHEANLSFHKLACIVRALIAEKPDDKRWELILDINSLRNQLAHKLEPHDLDRRIAKILGLDKEVQPTEGITLDKSAENFKPPEGLRQAIVSCMQFLQGAIARRSPNSGAPTIA